MFGQKHGAKAWPSVIYGVIIGVVLQLASVWKDHAAKEDA